MPARLHWFETEVLSQAENLEGLSRINRELIAKAEAMDSPRRLCWIWTAANSLSTENRSRVHTMGILSPPAITRCCCSTEKEIVWEQNCVPATYIVPRTGRNASAGDRAPQGLGKEVVFRPDAAFAKPEIYEALKKTGGSTDGDKLVAAMKGVKLVSPRGPILIDPETRDIVQTVYIRKVEKTAGGLYNVEFDKFPDQKDPGK